MIPNTVSSDRYMGPISVQCYYSTHSIASTIAKMAARWPSKAFDAADSDLSELDGDGAWADDGEAGKVLPVRLPLQFAIPSDTRSLPALTK